MSTRRLLTILLTGLITVGSTAGAVAPADSHPSEGDSTAGSPARPFPQHVRLANGRQPSDVSQARLDRDVLRFWRAWKVKYLRTGGGPGMWVRYDRSDSTVSEAIGYGMVFAAYMADRHVFDGLFSYFSAHPSRYTADLMAWKQVMIDGRMTDVAGSDSATDGDMDVAYALLLADKQWGSRDGVDYAGAARRISRAVLRSEVNSRLHSTMPGDWAEGRDRRHTRTSDFMPGHLAAFAAADPGRAARWRAVLRRQNATVRYQYRRGSRGTGLMPDFMVHRAGHWVPVSGEYLESTHDGEFNWNACRTPWRLAIPYLFDGRAALQRPITTQARWFRRSSQGRPNHVRAGYFVSSGPNGRPYASYTNLAFTAPATVNAMAARGAKGQRWLNRLYSFITHKPEVTGYYGDSLRLMALLALSRNWWQPESPRGVR